MQSTGGWGWGGGGVGGEGEGGKGRRGGRGRGGRGRGVGSTEHRLWRRYTMDRHKHGALEGMGYEKRIPVLLGKEPGNDDGEMMC